MRRSDLTQREPLRAQVRADIPKPHQFKVTFKETFSLFTLVKAVLFMLVVLVMFQTITDSELPRCHLDMF